MALTQAELDRILGKQSVVQRAFEANQPTVTNTPRSMVSGTWADILKPIVSNPVGEFVGAADMQRALDSASYGKPLTTGGSVQTGGFRPEYLAAALGLTPVGKGKKVKTTFEAAQETAQRNASLPIAEGGLGLPANNTAMDRAKAMGFDIKGYTGSKDDIRIADVNKASGKSADTGIWFTDSPDRANTYAGTFQGGNVTPALLNRGNILNVEANSKNWNRLGADTKVSAPKITIMDNQDVDLLNQLGINASPKQITKKPFNKTLKKMFPDEFLWDDYFSTDDLARFGRGEGYDSSQFNNVVDIGPYGMMVNEAATKPATNYVIYKPENVRSINAAFDPFRRNEPDILAGVAAAPVGLLELNKDKKKKN